MQVETLAASLDTPWALDFTPDGRKPAGFETHLHKQYSRLRDVVRGRTGRCMC